MFRNNLAAESIAVVLFLSLVSFGCVAHEERIATLASSDKVYELPDPLGRLVVSYATDGNGRPSLRFKCALFEGEAPLAALTDLPNPGWDRLTVRYSFSSTSPISELSTIIIKVPLDGTPDVFWVMTDAIFLFDATGKLTRFLQWVPTARPSEERSFNEIWKIGSGISAESLMQGPRE